MADQTPKFSLKMLAFPAMFIIGRKIDFKDPTVVSYAQTGFITVIVVMLSLYFYVYTKISTSTDSAPVWIPVADPADALMKFFKSADEQTPTKKFTKTTIKKHGK